MTPNIPYSRLRYRQRVLSRVRPFFYGDTLLDSGCGDGEDDLLFLDHFKKIHGIDLEENKLWKERATDRLEFSAGNSESLAFPDNSFDTVMEKDMLHHAQNPERALREMARVSKKRVIAMECNRYNPLLYLNMTLRLGHQHFTQKRFTQIMASAGVPYEIKHFSARLIPFESRGPVDFFEGIENLLEKIPFYAPIIEYNLGILTK
jgi:ubiquinone/menaquinone biosynthesis C-methylase UbiE